MSRIERKAGLALTGIVVVSASARFAVSRTFHAPWIAPDEMAYGLLGETLWQTGELTMRGVAAGYYSLVYPAFVGGPLVLAGAERGIGVVQGLQALAMSAVAVPVFVWGRALVSERLALAAAVLAVLPPSLAYSGLLMSEALYYPAFVVALFALARAVEQPTVLRLGTAVALATFVAAIRLQALVLLPAFVVALGVDAALARDRIALTRLLRLAGVAGVALAIAAWLAGRTASWSSLLGAYEPVGDEQPGLLDLLGGLVRTGGGLLLVSLVVPLLATAVLVWRAAAHGEPDPRVRAFLATAVATVGCVWLQVAIFASSFVAYVPERYVASVAPLLFLGLCLWVDRGAPAQRVALAAAAVPALVVAVVLGPSDLFAAVGVHDLLTLLALQEAGEGAPAWLAKGLFAAGVLLAAALVALLPRRRAPLLIVIVALGLAAASIGSSARISHYSALEEAKAFGEAGRGWIDAVGLDASVALLDTGDREWPIVPRTAFWNRRVVTLARLPGAHGSGAIPQAAVAPDARGVLRSSSGRGLAESYVVAPTGATLEGEKLAEIPPTSVAAGLALWQVTAPARLESLTVGLGANGDFASPVQVTVFGCAPGRLELTLLGKSGRPIAISANGIPRQVVAPAPDGLWQGGVQAPPNVDGSSPCVFELTPEGLAGSTRIEYVPDPA